MKSLPGRRLNFKRLDPSELQAVRLITWLNLSRGTQAYKRVTSLLIDLQRLLQRVPSSDLPMVQAPGLQTASLRGLLRKFPAMPQKKIEELHLICAINRRLRRYETYPSVAGIVPPRFFLGKGPQPPNHMGSPKRKSRQRKVGYLQFCFTTPKGPYTRMVADVYESITAAQILSRPAVARKTRVRLDEADAIAELMSLEGFISSLRQCSQCQAWFYARFRDQRSCSLKCRQKKYRSSEEAKERHREYMREYMREYNKIGRDK